MGKRNAAAAIVDADRLQQFETPPKRMKHAPAATTTTPSTLPPTSPANDSACEFTLSKEFVDGTKLMDLTLKQWRIGKPIGKGSFGEIFLASDDIDTPVTSENANYVVKIEPHSNGPLFVEIHCLLNTAKRSETCHIPPGMPEYIASGSHMFKNERYRFLILKRYERDLHSLIKNKRVNPKSIPVVACQILDVLEHLHDQGYVHSDIKAENLMIGKVENGEGVMARTSHTNGRNGTTVCQNRSPNNGTTLANGGAKAVGRGGKKALDEASFGGHLVENGLYQHQEQEMGGGRSRNLRPLKTVTYRDLSDEDGGGKKPSTTGHRKRGRKKNNDASFSCSISPRRSGYDELRAATLEAHRNELHLKQQQVVEQKKPLEAPEERIHLIDFGLASKFMDSTGQHRPFCMDQRRAHDGTLEFTSRDAHMGAHARRSDLECLGYNLVYWSRGFLPWKDEKLLNQPEQVHRMKEYFMTDVREMLRLIYGDECPAYLGDFLAYVGQLTYDERPDYQHCRALFLKELKRLGCPVGGGRSNHPLRLDVEAIERQSEPLTAQDEAEITNKINHVKSLMKLGALFPYRESTLHSKATSPKNLRSKRRHVNGRNAHAVGGNGSEATTGVASSHGAAGDGGLAAAALGSSNAVGARKREKKISCEEIFATDADQIARERVEKEYERAEQMEETVIRYTGRPTYAIQELERKMRYSGAGHTGGGGSGGLDYTESEDYIKGYTKPMMDILRKRQSQLFREIEATNAAAKRSKEEVVQTETADDGEANAEEGEGEEEPMEQEEAAAEEDGEDEAEKDNDDDEGDDDDDDEAEKRLRRQKYYHDTDYEVQPEEEEEEEDELSTVEEEEEEVEEEEEEEVVVSRKGSKGRPKAPKGASKQQEEDTDSDFFNDEEQEVEEQEEGEEDDDQQDSDFNDQETSITATTTSESEVVIHSSRRRKAFSSNRRRSKTKSANGKISVKGRGGRRKRKSSKSNASPLGIDDGIHDNGDDGAMVNGFVVERFGRKAIEGRHSRKKRRADVVHDDEDEEDDGDNARHNGHVLGAPTVTVRHQHNNNNNCNSKAYYGDVDDSSHDAPPALLNGSGLSSESKYRLVKRRKSGLRERIRPTDRGNDYNQQRKQKAAQRDKRRSESQAAAALGLEVSGVADLESTLHDDEASCSSSIISSSSGGGSSTSTTTTGSDGSVSSGGSRASSSRGGGGGGAGVGSRDSVPSSAVSEAASSVAAPSTHDEPVAPVAPVQQARKRGRPRKVVVTTPVVAEEVSEENVFPQTTTTHGSSKSGRRRREEECSEKSASAREAAAAAADGSDATPHWSQANSHRGSVSTTTATSSRSSSVSASNGGSGPERLPTLPEDDDFLDEDDDDTRDVDYSPVCTRRKRKALTTTTSSGNGISAARKTTAPVRKRNDSKGGNSRGTGPAPSSSSSVAVRPVADNGVAINQQQLPGGRVIAQPSVRRPPVEPPPQQPPPPAVVAIQPNRGRRLPAHHQNYYHPMEEPPRIHHQLHHHHQHLQHHHPPTMLVRTYSRG